MPPCAGEAASSPPRRRRMSSVPPTPRAKAISSEAMRSRRRSGTPYDVRCDGAPIHQHERQSNDEGL